MNLKANSNASIHIRDPRFFKKKDRFNLNMPRFSLFGQMLPQPTTNHEKNLACLLLNHPTARDWLVSEEGNLRFNIVFYKFKISNETSVMFLGGFGNDHYVGWVESRQYLEAKPSSEYEMTLAIDKNENSNTSNSAIKCHSVLNLFLFVVYSISL
jgi:hypothetical protein